MRSGKKSSKRINDEEHRARLRAAIAEGIRDHAEGRYIEITTAAEHRAFFDAIKRRKLLTDLDQGLAQAKRGELLPAQKVFAALRKHKPASRATAE